MAESVVGQEAVYHLSRCLMVGQQFLADDSDCFIRPPLALGFRSLAKRAGRNPTEGWNNSWAPGMRAGGLAVFSPSWGNGQVLAQALLS